MKYSIVAAALVSAVMASPPAYDSWGSSAPAAPAYSSAPAAPSYPAESAPAESAPAYGWGSSSAAPAPSSEAYPVPSSAPAAPSYGGSWGTSTVDVTTEVTVTSCGSYVTDCPAGSSAAPVYSTPVESSPVAPYPTESAGWGSSPAAPAYPTGTGAPAPAQSSWAPVPATGAGSTAKTGGILAAAGALFALFL